jgi:alkanesulfonate monooxygenase SsuD/methylene tetrahydromethanopterin reductase-like flavin-dependent oxidoreductase (luciferase family)
MRLGAYLSPGADLPVAVALAERAERLGYESVWVTHGVGRDSFLVLAAYGAATRTIRLGNGVVPVYTRHPVATAQAALTLAEMTGGRFRLGIGVSHRPMVEGMLGVPLADPLGVTREYVEVLRGAFGAGASVEGRHYRVKWSLGLPARPPAPAIYLATLGPKMCELAGETADGAILWLCTPEYIRRVAMPAFERGRRRAGKSLDGFDVVAAVPLAVTGDRDAALRAFRAELTRYLMLPFYRSMLEGSGFGGALAEFDRTGDTPGALADALGAVGPADLGRAFVRAYREAGVTLPAVRPITFPDAAWYRPTLEAAAGW